MDRSVAAALLERGDYLELFGVRDPAAEKRQIVLRSHELEGSHPNMARLVVEARALLLTAPDKYLEGRERRQAVLARLRREGRRMMGTDAEAVLGSLCLESLRQGAGLPGVDDLLRALVERGCVSPRTVAGEAPAESPPHTQADSGPRGVTVRPRTMPAVPPLPPASALAAAVPPSADPRPMRGVRWVRRGLLVAVFGFTIVLLLAGAWGLIMPVLRGEDEPPSTGTGPTDRAGDLDTWPRNHPGVVVETDRDGRYRVLLGASEVWGGVLVEEFTELELRARAEILAGAPQIVLAFGVQDADPFFLYWVRPSGAWRLEGVTAEGPRVLSEGQGRRARPGPVSVGARVRSANIDLLQEGKVVGSVTVENAIHTKVVGFWAKAGDVLALIRLLSFEVWEP